MVDAANASHLAAENDVRRKFVCQQRTKARDALEEAFGQTAGDDGVLSLPPCDQSMAASGRSRTYAYLPQILPWCDAYVPRDINHTHVSQALRDGAELTAVRDNLRHASIVTASFYRHSDDVKRARQMAAVFAESTQ